MKKKHELKVKRSVIPVTEEANEAHHCRCHGENEESCDHCTCNNLERNLDPNYVDRSLIDVTTRLMAHENRILDLMSPKMKENGFVCTEDKHIMFIGEEEWVSAFTPGVALANHDIDIPNSFAACSIVNTIDNGFRFAGVDDNGHTMDLGPVNVPCIIGNVYKPQGLYIPMNVTNSKAIMEGIEYALDFLTFVDDRNNKLKENNNTAKENWN